MGRFLTLFPQGRNIELVKDVGMIPFILAKFYNYSSSIATYKNGEYPYLETDLKGLNHLYISRIFKSEKWNMCLFIIRNFWKFDVLNMYHLSYTNVLILSLFKFLNLFNSKCRTYLKLDSDGTHLEFIKKRRIIFWLFTKIDLVSVECEGLANELNNQNTLNRKIEYIPNGFFSEYSHSNFENKKKVILTVGRIGSYQKNNELLIDAFMLIYNKIPEWSLMIVGPTEDSFIAYLSSLFVKFPELRQRIILTGNIENRMILKEKYDQAKIFCLTSRSEGFPLVFLEALSSGCFIISSDLVSARDVIGNTSYGCLLKSYDKENLAELLLKECLYNHFSKSFSNEIKEYSYNKYSWKNIIGRLKCLLYEE